MATDTQLTWRKCPTCGYLVPAQQSSCSRCAPAATPAPATAAPAPLHASVWPAPVSAPATEPPPPPPPPPPPGAVGWSAPVGELLPAAPAGGARHAPVDPGFRRVGRIVAAIVVVVALVGVGLATVLGSSDQPAQWDPRLGDLPATVARLRGLQFAHPVPVRYESASRFVKELALGSETPSVTARLAAARATESLRAMGLVSGKVDLFAAGRASRESRVLAFYDPVAKEVVIRGGTTQLDVPHRVVLAHELTHVLQDQHFDLPRLQDAVRRAPGQSPEALRAAIEGDADRIEDKYLSGLSAHDRTAFRSWERASVAHADQATADVPAVVTVNQSAPYSLGSLALQVVSADGGNAAVDRVFEHGVFTQELFVEPTTSLTEASPELLAAPRAMPGERTIGTTDELGAFDLYLLLASRIDSNDALDAASGWAGGRGRTVRADGSTCVRVAVTASTGPGANQLERALQRWSAALPAGMATVQRQGRVMTIRSCDPGAGSSLASPDAAITHAQTTLEAHNEIEVALLRQTSGRDLPRGALQCAARGFVRSPELALVLLRPERDISAGAVSTAIKAAAPAVRDACGL